LCYGSQVDILTFRGASAIECFCAALENRNSWVNALWHRNELTMRLFAAHDFLRQNPYAEA
jgi:hypothetical protein